MGGGSRSGDGNEGVCDFGVAGEDETGVALAATAGERTRDAIHPFRPIRPCQAFERQCCVGCRQIIAQIV